MAMDTDHLSLHLYFPCIAPEADKNIQLVEKKSKDNNNVIASWLHRN
jgi:hypothetical protein